MVLLHARAWLVELLLLLLLEQYYYYCYYYHLISGAGNQNRRWMLLAVLPSIICPSTLITACGFPLRFLRLSSKHPLSLVSLLLLYVRFLSRPTLLYLPLDQLDQSSGSSLVSLAWKPHCVVSAHDPTIPIPTQHLNSF